MFKLFKKHSKPFRCGGESCIEFTKFGLSSLIYFRQPTGDEILNFAHMALENEESEIKELKGEVKPLDIHQIMRSKKLIPYALKIISRVVNYVDEGGNEVDIDYVKKYFPHHLEAVALEAFKADDKYKKKS